MVETDWRLPRIEVAGDICLRRPRPTEGCRVDDDDEGDEHLSYLTEGGENVYSVWSWFELRV